MRLQAYSPVAALPIDAELLETSGSIGCGSRLLRVAHRVGDDKREK